MTTSLLKALFVVAGIFLNFLFIVMLQELSRDMNTSIPFGYIYGCIYVAYAAIILSPFGDKWINLTFGAREPTSSESARLNQMRDELEKKSSALGKPFPKKLSLMMMTEPYPNAMAFGHQSLAFSTGLLKSCDHEEVRAVMAHEIGHIVAKDTFSSLLVIVSFGPLLWLGRMHFRAIGKSRGHLFIFLFLVMMTVVFFPASMAAILYAAYEGMRAVTSQKAEFRADAYAATLSGKEGLVRFLEQIEHLDHFPHGQFLAAYTASHPPTAVRIDRIENLST